MLSGKDVGDYFLSLCDENAGDLISNMKLQKLLYYAQGLHLAAFDEPLFEDRIEAWTHGPVVPAVYHALKRYGGQALPIPTDLDLSKFDERTRGLLDEVYKVFGQFSAWKLSNMTHEEPPWKEAAGSPLSKVISHEALTQYFKTQLA